MTGLGWLIRRMMIKYERALVAAEQTRRQVAETELAELKKLISGLHSAVSRVTKEQEAIKIFLGDWARKLTTEVGSLLKFNQKDTDELREVLEGLLKFLGSARNSEDETAIKQIGKDLWLVHKKEKEEKRKL